MTSDIKPTEILHSIDEISLFNILFIIVAAWLLIVTSQKVIPWTANRLPGRLRHYLLPLSPVLRLIIIIVAILSLVPEIINPSLQNLWTILATAGIAIGFAFKDYISSIIAGIVVIIERPYRVGDWAEVDGNYGEIKNMGLRAFQIVTPDDSVITIPHSKIWSNNISNANDGSQQHMCVAHFYLHPLHDSEQASISLYDVALTSAYLDPKMPISVIINEKSGATHYQLKAYPVNGRHEFRFITDLTIRGKDALAAQNIKPSLVPDLSQEGN